MGETQPEQKNRLPSLGLAVGALGVLGLPYSIYRMVWIFRHEEELQEGSFAASGLLEIGMAVASVLVLLYSFECLRQWTVNRHRSAGNVRPGEALSQFDSAVTSVAGDALEVFASSEGLFLRPMSKSAAQKLGRWIERVGGFLILIMFYSFAQKNTGIWEWVPVWGPLIVLRVIVGVFEIKDFVAENSSRERFKVAAARGVLGVDARWFISLGELRDTRRRQESDGRVVLEFGDSQIQIAVDDVTCTKFFDMLKSRFGDAIFPRDSSVSKARAREEPTPPIESTPVPLADASGKEKPPEHAQGVGAVTPTQSSLKSRTSEAWAIGALSYLGDSLPPNRSVDRVFSSVKALEVVFDKHTPEDHEFLVEAFDGALGYVLTNNALYFVLAGKGSAPSEVRKIPLETISSAHIEKGWLSDKTVVTLDSGVKCALDGLGAHLVVERLNRTIARARTVRLEAHEV